MAIVTPIAVWRSGDRGRISVQTRALSTIYAIIRQKNKSGGDGERLNVDHANKRRPTPDGGRSS
jgi:hypothetical protein